jgi:hypothetical protein
MSSANERLNDGLDRLQEHLVAMRDGDELTCADAARVSGLSQPICRTVLERLARAGMMSGQEGDRFVRRVQILQPS